MAERSLRLERSTNERHKSCHAAVIIGYETPLMTTASGTWGPCLDWLASTVQILTGRGGAMTRVTYGHWPGQKTWAVRSGLWQILWADECTMGL